MSVVTAREEILATVQRALRGEAGVEDDMPTLPPFYAEHGLQQGGDLLRQFESEVTKVGGRFHRALSGESACAYVAQVAAERGARSIVGWETPLIDEIGLRSGLARSEIRFTTEAESGEIVARAAASEVGVTGVDFALAETGSLVLLAHKGQARSVSLLPPVHIALVKPDQVLFGFDDLFSSLRRDSNSPVTQLSSAITFITGPSRTADIELTLVVGVHGPQQLHVVLLQA